MKIGPCLLELKQGDITLEGTHVVVNAANSLLAGGGGVDGAIHAASGVRLAEECRAIIARIGRLEPGQAVCTSGGKMKAGAVIHTVGPVWRGGARCEEKILRSAYRESLELAVKKGFESVAFPSISTGVYGYPVEKAAAAALSETAAFLKERGKPKLVRFVLYDETAFAAYEAAMKSL